MCHAGFKVEYQVSTTQSVEVTAGVFVTTRYVIKRNLNTSDKKRARQENNSFKHLDCLNVSITHGKYVTAGVCYVLVKMFWSTN